MITANHFYSFSIKHGLVCADASCLLVVLALTSLPISLISHSFSCSLVSSLQFRNELIFDIFGFFPALLHAEPTNRLQLRCSVC